jgi:glycosidase
MKKLTPIILSIIFLIGIIACNSGKKTKVDNCCSSKNSGIVSETVIPDWSYDATIYEVNIRQFTPEGTFEAFLKHLPRLSEMGVEILWIMPIHPIGVKGRKGTLGSYYAVKDYKAVNPEFGTLDDFKTLVEQAHQLGMKVIIDWVANHTSWDSNWIVEHPEWFTHDESNKIVAPVEDWSDVADLNYDVREMRDAMIDALTYWVNEANIDGYRCDVAGMVPVDFWEEAALKLNEIKPMFMLAEDEGNIELLKKAFILNYSWSFHHTMNKIAKGEAGTSELVGHFAKADTVYPIGSYAMQFTSSHDENSWNGSEYERLGEAVQVMAALAFTVPGMPMIYSGQEAALTKRLEFFEKDVIDWSNLEMQSFYSKLIKLKKENKALWNGTQGGGIHFLKTVSDNGLVVFSREKENNKIIVLANVSTVKVDNEVACCQYSGVFVDYSNGETINLDEEKKISLEPWSFKILISKNK